MYRWLTHMFLPVLASGALLAACGSGSDSAEKQSVATAVATSAPAAQPAAAATTAPTAPAVAQAAPKLPVTVQDKDGRNVTIADVSRIVPLNGEITEIVYALGLGKNVVGVDISSTYPPEVKQVASIGYQRTLAAESILALRPTLVIGNENAGPPPVLEQLRSAGVPVLIMKYHTTLESVGPRIREVAAALGLPDAGATLATRTQTEIDAAKALAATSTSRPRVAFINVRSGGTQQIWGRGMPSNPMITAAGALDAGAESGINGSKPITAEAFVTAHPDVLLMFAASLQDAGGVEGVTALPGIAQTPAGKNKRILAYEDQYLLGLGPRTGQAMMELVKALHPELR